MAYIKREYLPTAADAHEKMSAAGHDHTQAAIGQRLGGQNPMAVDFFFDLVTAYDLGPQKIWLWLMEASAVRRERLKQRALRRPRYSKKKCTECGGYVSDDVPSVFKRCSCDDSEAAT